MEARSESRIPPPLTILMLVVGSKGDVDPFVSMAVLLKLDGHRVRLATHECFRSFVLSFGLEFFPLAGDPLVLTGFMCKVHGKVLSPMHLFTHLAMVKAIIHSTWEACVSVDDGDTFLPNSILANPPTWGGIHCAEKLGIPICLAFPQPWSIPTSAFPFPLVNGIGGGNRTNSRSVQNLLTYTIFDRVAWFGLETTINDFRVHKLGLPPLLVGQNGHSLINSRRIPFLGLWSNELLPRPSDYPSEAVVVGAFPCLQGPPAESLSSPPEVSEEDVLDEFFNRGAAPVYVGFGSMPDISSEVLSLFLLAAALTDTRILIQRGWGWSHVTDEEFHRLGKEAQHKAERMLAAAAELNDYDYVDGGSNGSCVLRSISRCGSGRETTLSSSSPSAAPELSILQGEETPAVRNPHSWSAESDSFIKNACSHSLLFPRCKGIVHHGGAGTLSSALYSAKPSWILSFFGDQSLWGSRVFDLCLGPRSIKMKHISLDSCCEAMKSLTTDEAMTHNAAQFSARLKESDSELSIPRRAVEAFYKSLPLESMLCEVSLLLGERRLATVQFGGLRVTNEVYLSQLQEQSLRTAKPLKFMSWNLGPTSLCEGVSQGAYGFISSVVSGATACLTNPISGGLNDGVRGVAGGVASGLVSLIQSPVRGAALLVHSIHVGLHHGKSAHPQTVHRSATLSQELLDIPLESTALLEKVGAGEKLVRERVRAAFKMALNLKNILHDVAGKDRSALAELNGLLTALQQDSCAPEQGLISFFDLASLIASATVRPGLINSSPASATCLL